MNFSRFKLLYLMTGLLWVSSISLAGCGGQELSSVFDEADVKKASENVVILVNQGDSEGLSAPSDAGLEAALTDDVLAQVFQAIGEGGAFTGFDNIKIMGMADQSIGDDLAVAIGNARHENTSFTCTISFNEQMELVGLYYR